MSSPLSCLDFSQKMTLKRNKTTKVHWCLKIDILFPKLFWPIAVNGQYDFWNRMIFNLVPWKFFMSNVLEQLEFNLDSETYLIWKVRKGYFYLHKSKYAIALLLLGSDYLADVLWGHPIKLTQVASNSELRENKWNNLLFFEIVPSHCFGASEASKIDCLKN